MPIPKLNSYHRDPLPQGGPSYYHTRRIQRIISESLANGVPVNKWPKLRIRNCDACEVAYLRTVNGGDHCVYIAIIQEMAAMLNFSEYIDPGIIIEINLKEPQTTEPVYNGNSQFPLWRNGPQQIKSKRS